MKRPFLRVIILLSLPVLAVMAVAQAMPPSVVRAATCQDTATLPDITSIEPSSIINTDAVTVIVFGGGFDADALVLLDGYGALATTYINGNRLTATVPAGVQGSTSGKQYNIWVVNPSDLLDEQACKENALRVFTPAASQEPTPTHTPAPTQFVRPILTVQSYGASSVALTAGENIDFEMTLQNSGQIGAKNVIVTFVAGDLIPRSTGGVQALGNISSGDSIRFFQPFTVNSELASSVATLEVQASYTDKYGTAYTETFHLSFPVAKKSGSGVAVPTATPTPGLRPQLVIDSYSTDVERLQPGATFELTLNVLNQGPADAKDVTLILGGGSASDLSGEGTPTMSGVSGGGGEFTNFAPLGSSNVQFLGSIMSGSSLSASQKLVVNVTTAPGAYPLKVSLTYTNASGQRFTDEQVVTLLVYSPVQIEVSFYRDPNPIFVGLPFPLPIQIVNLTQKAIVLGNMEISAQGAEMMNNTIFVGLLDVGYPFTLDASLMASQPGPLTLDVTIHYNDDFNQPRVIARTLEVVVLEGEPFMSGPGGPEGGPVEPLPLPPETLLEKIWRFIRGLLGLDSAPPTPTVVPGTEPIMPGGGAAGSGGGGGIGPAPTEAPVLEVPPPVVP